MLILSENLGDVEKVAEAVEQVTLESLQAEEDANQKHVRPKTLRMLSCKYLFCHKKNN